MARAKPKARQSEKTPARTRRRPPRSAWKPGQSGNPAGRPTGSRHRATILAQAMLDAEGEKIVRTVIKAALAGDMPAARLVLERLVPPMRERPITVDLPADTTTAVGLAAAADAILRGVASGSLLPGEASALAAIVETRRKAVETQELEARISALEGAKR